MLLFQADVATEQGATVVKPSEDGSTVSERGVPLLAVPAQADGAPINRGGTN